jgi:hypothetical protein
VRKRKVGNASEGNDIDGYNGMHVSTHNRRQSVDAITVRLVGRGEDEGWSGERGERAGREERRGRERGRRREER